MSKSDKKPSNIGGTTESDAGSTAQSSAPFDAELDAVKEPTKVDYGSRMDVDEAVAYFEAITAGLKKGTLTFRQGSGTMRLTPNRQVDLKVKASKKGDKGKIVFEIAWKSAKKEVFSIS